MKNTSTLENKTAKAEGKEMKNASTLKNTTAKAEGKVTKHTWTAEQWALVKGLGLNPTSQDYKSLPAAMQTPAVLSHVKRSVCQLKSGAKKRLVKH